jgi:hypothetical protein
MAKGVLFIGWGPAVRGRERQAVKVFQEALAYHQRLQQSGRIDSFEPIALEPHGGDLEGFLLVKGDADKLAQLRIDQEFVSLNTRAQLVVENFGVVGGFYGAELQALFADFDAAASELA